MNRVIPAVLAGGVAGTVLRWAVGELEGGSIAAGRHGASGVLGGGRRVAGPGYPPAGPGCGTAGSAPSGFAVELAQQLDRGDPWDAVVLIVASLVLGGGAFLGGREVVS